jgi:hypothetical protein
MKFGIANLSIVPVRTEPKEQSEQVTQILFGETFSILERRKTWYYIISNFDNYEGWIDTKLVKIITEDEFNQINFSNKIITNDIITIITKESDKTALLIVAGSALPNFNETDSSFTICDEKYFVNQNISKLTNNVRKEIISTALKFINAPYLWGGSTHFGIDCSGFSQIVYKICGIDIPRDASQQVNIGTTLNIIDEAKKGDLVFFDNDEGKIIHVGIFMDNERIIHASGGVRIDKIDHQGVFNEELNEYTHNLRVIQNIIDFQ